MRTALARKHGTSGAVADLSTGAVRELREKRSEEMTGRAQVQVTQKKTSFLTKGTQC